MFISVCERRIVCAKEITELWLWLLLVVPAAYIGPGFKDVVYFMF